MIQELHCHLNVGRLTRDYNKSFPFATRCRRTIETSPRFHDFDLASTQMSNFIDLASAFADDASDQIVRNINLLCLQLLLLGCLMGRNIGL